LEADILHLLKKPDAMGAGRGHQPFLNGEEKEEGGGQRRNKIRRRVQGRVMHTGDNIKKKGRRKR